MFRAVRPVLVDPGEYLGQFPDDSRSVIVSELYEGWEGSHFALHQPVNMNSTVRNSKVFQLLPSDKHSFVGHGG